MFGKICFILYEKKPTIFILIKNICGSNLCPSVYLMLIYFPLQYDIYDFMRVPVICAVRGN